MTDCFTRFARVRKISPAFRRVADRICNASMERESRLEPTNADCRAVWQRIARWWDSAIGEGNEFQQQLIMPATDRLLGLEAGQVVLDIACGNGNYARRMGRLGATVVACDGAPEFIACARERHTQADGNVTYAVVDATNDSALLLLGEGRFDAAVCSMAMMDLPTLAPLLSAARRLLKPGGRFVFSVSHPCFTPFGSKLTAELVQDGGKLSQQFGVHVSEYLEPVADFSVGIINQPEPHVLFHRPLHNLLGDCFAAGFVVDALEEPAFAPGSAAKSAFAWAKRPQIPPALVVRLR